MHHKIKQKQKQKINIITIEEFGNLDNFKSQREGRNAHGKSVGFLVLGYRQSRASNQTESFTDFLCFFLEKQNAKKNVNIMAKILNNTF